MNSDLAGILGIEVYSKIKEFEIGYLLLSIPQSAIRNPQSAFRIPKSRLSVFPKTEAAKCQ